MTQAGNSHSFLKGLGAPCPAVPRIRTVACQWRARAGTVVLCVAEHGQSFCFLNFDPCAIAHFYTYIIRVAMRIYILHPTATLKPYSFRVTRKFCHQVDVFTSGGFETACNIRLSHSNSHPFLKGLAACVLFGRMRPPAISR